VVKDPVQDAIVWREYLETVVKEREGWRDFYPSPKWAASARPLPTTLIASAVESVPEGCFTLDLPSATIEAEIAIVETRVASLGRAFEIPAEPPGADEIRRVASARPLPTTLIASAVESVPEGCFTLDLPSSVTPSRRATSCRASRAPW
jgi:hypothetical protein